MTNARWALVVATMLTGCGKKNTVAPTTSSTGQVGCNDDKRVQAYASGMRVDGAAYTFELTEADPAPPARGGNVWKVRLLDHDKNPVTGAQITVRPYMPDHGHGASAVPNIAADGDTYIISNLDLFMPGVWELTLKQTGAGTGDTAKFTFCVN